MMNMGNRSTLVSVRIPNNLMKLQGTHETDTEFIIRAVKALRPYNHVTNDMEHELLVKMIKKFVESGMKMSLTKDEVEVVKKLYKE